MIKSTFLRCLLTLGHPYKMSSQRELYEGVAKKFGTTPDVVYKIAHNKKPNVPEYDDVFNELIRLRIIRSW